MSLTCDLIVFVSFFSGLQEFKNEKFRGRFLTVSVARENFMEKLKREREESTQPTQSPLNTARGIPDVVIKPIIVSNPFRSNVEKSSKVTRTFDSCDDEVSNNSFQSMSHATTVEPESCIKRKSNVFTENGKVGGYNRKILFNPKEIKNKNSFSD